MNTPAQPKRAADKPVRLTADARAALRDLTYVLTGVARRPVTMSDAVIAAHALAVKNAPAAAALLPPYVSNPEGSPS